MGDLVLGVEDGLLGLEDQSDVLVLLLVLLLVGAEEFLVVFVFGDSLSCVVQLRLFVCL